MRIRSWRKPGSERAQRGVRRRPDTSAAVPGTGDSPATGQHAGSPRLLVARSPRRGGDEEGRHSPRLPVSPSFGHHGPTPPGGRTCRPARGWWGRSAAGKLVAALALGAAATLAGCSGGNGRQVLTIYSPHGRDLLSAFEQRYEASHPNVDVQWIDMGSQEILDRLRSEKANPQADVWWGGPSQMFATAAQDDLLTPYRPSWADEVGAAHSANSDWWAVYLTPMVIAYNSEVVPPDSAPKDWADVLAPKWKDKVLIRDPLASGTMRTIFGMIVERSLRETGDTAQAFQWLRRLDAQTKEYVLNPTLLYQKLARQEGLVTLWDLPDIETLRSTTRLPIAYTLPTSGTPVVMDAIALVAGAPHPELAKAFIDWVGQLDQVELAARQFHRLPARTDVPDSALGPSLREAQKQIVPEKMDWAMLEQRGSDWMRYWDEHVRSAR
ncbi:MAG: extracellular solute-binding protein [Gemmatimonadota bacterium]